MEFRSATREDLDGVRRLVAVVGREFGFEPEPEGADLDLYGDVDAYFAASAWLQVLVRDGEIVGALGVIPLSPSVFELRKLYLAATERSAGHGRRMAMRAIQFATEQGAEKLVLQSSLKLTAALELYRSLGFTEVANEGRSATCDVSMELALAAP